MDERVFGSAGGGASAGRRRRLRAMLRGYPIAVVVMASWLLTAASDGSRYDAPLWAWIAAIAVAAGLSLAGLVVGVWFLRKRRQVSEE